MATATPDDLAARFRAALAADPDADLADFLPPPGSPARPAALLALVAVDLDQRGRAGRAARVDRYLRRFPADLPAAAVPVAVLYEEYRTRHRYGDNPTLDEYRSRFPARFDEFRKYLAAHPVGHGPTGTLRPPSDDSFSLPDTALPDVDPPTPSVTGTPDLPAGPADYRFVRTLGKGAFGTVYQAEAPGGVPVAVKQIHRGIEDPYGRSEMEALTAIKKLSHPFLTQIHQFWVERGQLFIVMELADETLADRVAAYKARGLPGVPVGELVTFFAQAAAALDYLHSKNVSHRDIKPQNLLVMKGYAKVADLGLARTHSNTETTVGGECGTPLYMAPEVWHRKVSLHSDQYSLAASYVTARLGRPMFSCDTLVELGIQHLTADPDLDPLPAAEQRVLRRALAKNPNDRFPSCGAFMDALKDAVAPPPPAPPRATRRSVVAAGVLLVCGLSAGAAVLALRGSGPAETTWVPPRWVASGDEKAEPDQGGRRLYRQIERAIDGTTVVARLVSAPANRTTEARPFYMTRDKITYRVFAAAWAAAEADGESELNRFKRSEQFRPELLPGEWREGARDLNWNRLKPEGDRLDLPVVGVTAVEAALVAAQLGGRLPSQAECLRAAGAGENRRYTPPGGRPPADRLALGLSGGPWPVTRETADVSVHGIHQLSSNGLEWTRDTKDGKQLTPGTLGEVEVNPLVQVVGEGCESKAEAFGVIHPRAHNWTETGPQIGFRIVLELP